MKHNLSQVQILVSKAIAAGAKVRLIAPKDNINLAHPVRKQALFLPEASDWISHSGEETLTLVRSVKDSLYVRGLQKLAKENKLAITAGIHEPGEKGSGKVKNTAIWISEGGEIVERYQKLHMFDMELTNGPHAHEGEYVLMVLLRLVN